MNFYFAAFDLLTQLSLKEVQQYKLPFNFVQFDIYWMKNVPCFESLSDCHEIEISSQKLFSWDLSSVYLKQMFSRVRVWMHRRQLRSKAFWFHLLPSTLFVAQQTICCLAHYLLPSTILVARSELLFPPAAPPHIFSKQLFSPLHSLGQKQPYLWPHPTYFWSDTNVSVSLYVCLCVFLHSFQNKSTFIVLHDQEHTYCNLCFVCKEI